MNRGGGIPLQQTFFFLENTQCSLSTSIIQILPPLFFLRVGASPGIPVGEPEPPTSLSSYAL